MATVTATGAGSGLNVNSLVTQLVAAERAPYDTRIARGEAKVTTEVSALAQLKGAMSTLQAAMAELAKPEAHALRKATRGSEDFFDVAVTAESAPGNYQVEVQQLAKGAQLGSAGIPGGAIAAAGTGTLTIALGATSFSVTLGAEANTLADLRTAINKATDNPGVTASLITDVSGTHLVLGSTKTGEANALRVTTTGGDGQLSRFVHDLPNGSAMTEISPAQDAIVLVSGYEIRDGDNLIEGAIDGVSLTLKKQSEVGEPTSLGITMDNAGIRAKAERFVSTYNVLATQIAKLRSFDADTKAAGPLLGDAMLRGIETQLRRIIADPVAGQESALQNTLAGLGITSQADGTLKLDATRFDAAIAKDPSAASRVFSGTAGVAGKLDTFLKDRLSSTSELASRDERLKARSKDLDKQKEALEARMAVIQARYQKQYNALDSLLTQMQSTSSYLASQLASLPGAASS